jgi:CsoR family transcriptional regulator, copper-sensing transcriptional repressor
MRLELKNGRLFLHRKNEERDPMLQRLARIEGQVRGLRQMIEADRYCGDELQLASAILAAMREVMRMLVSQHFAAGLRYISDNPDQTAETIIDIEAVLRPLLREQ